MHSHEHSFCLTLPLSSSNQQVIGFCRDLFRTRSSIATWDVPSDQRSKIVVELFAISLTFLTIPNKRQGKTSVVEKRILYSCSGIR